MECWKAKSDDHKYSDEQVHSLSASLREVVILPHHRQARWERRAGTGRRGTVSSRGFSRSAAHERERPFDSHRANATREDEGNGKTKEILETELARLMERKAIGNARGALRNGLQQLAQELHQIRQCHRQTTGNKSQVQSAEAPPAVTEVEGDSGYTGREAAEDRARVEMRANTQAERKTSEKGVQAVTGPEGTSRVSTTDSSCSSYRLQPSPHG